MAPKALPPKKNIEKKSRTIRKGRAIREGRQANQEICLAYLVWVRTLPSLVLAVFVFKLTGKKANISSSLLRVFVVIIFTFLLVLYLANNLFDFISVLLKFSLSGFTNLQLFKGHISDITFEKALSFLSFQAILSAPFYLYARRANREFQEERVRLHALMRDRNLILLWSAQERENKALFSGKLFDQMTQSNTADLSLKMMHPKHAGRHQKTDQGLPDKIADLVKRNPPPDTP
ncbi:MAG: hypothetical protein ACON4G_09920 [Candidatus Puniceispirillaceae bacterium]